MAFELFKDVKAFATAGVLAACLVSISSEAAEVAACPTFDAQAAVSDEVVFGVAGKLAPGVEGIAERRMKAIEQAYVQENAAFWQEVQAKAQAAWGACKASGKSECVADLLKRESLVNQSTAYLGKLAAEPGCQAKLEQAENALISRQFIIAAEAGSTSPEFDGWAVGEFLYEAKIGEVQSHFSGI